MYAGKIKKEMEKKKLMSDNQAGFRRGRGVMDNVYILNYLIDRNLNKKGEKVVAFFMDLKAAFDSLDKRIISNIYTYIYVCKPIEKGTF